MYLSYLHSRVRVKKQKPKSYSCVVLSQLFIFNISHIVDSRPRPNSQVVKLDKFFTHSVCLRASTLVNNTVEKQTVQIKIK